MFSRNPDKSRVLNKDFWWKHIFVLSLCVIAAALLWFEKKVFGPKKKVFMDMFDFKEEAKYQLFSRIWKPCWVKGISYCISKPFV
ncbi:hypothetical protein RchiOBHm_Chr6g0277861 [Rosa chinensis]|uniref:Uncharacterized protein n=1 Tax=Rosa chinensis TaxID=74649 RepID=A0A2P6PSL3_ROSCH|nr:hypothetical protein RchiOBHm_Chr6g0277861 [Rosa chinensis]